MGVLQMTECDSCVTGNAGWTRLVSTSTPLGWLIHGWVGVLPAELDTVEIPRALFERLTDSLAFAA
jgi:hypothetical protein